MLRTRGPGEHWRSLLPLVFVAAGCGAEFDPGSQIENLRVLGVKKSAPYARPGQAVDLELLWHDAGPREGRAVPEIAWAAVCRNPPGDLFELCFAQLPDADPDELAELISLPEPGALTANDTFSFETAPDIISSRPPPEGASAPYGLHYVFFAVCAGRLTALPEAQGLPFACYEERDGEPGLTEGDEQLDSTRFIVGYTAVFAYDDFRNANPIVNGMEFGGVTLWPASDVGSAPQGAAVLSPPHLCVGSECAPPPADDTQECPPELRVDVCDGDCDDISVRPLVDPGNAEVDDAATQRGSQRLLEQMWVNYYAARGEMDQEVRLLNDATRGWNEDFGTFYRPDAEPGIAYVWAVAHDNRGGAEWARLRLCIEEP
jgi:hypothetical protein